MGGDHAPKVVIQGAARAYKNDHQLRFIFFGDEVKIARYVKTASLPDAVYTVHHAPDAIASDTRPSVALRQGKQSSMHLAIQSVRDQRADGIVSGGNTGALMVLAKHILKTLPGIARPAITGFIPTPTTDTVLLDLGANIECSPRHLFEFALMGEAFCRITMGKTNPSIAILNVGSEDTKGHETLRQAAASIRDSDLNDQFIGFIESNHVIEGKADVVVTDGFTGNVMLKAIEGTGRFFSGEIRAAFSQSWSGKLVAPLALLALRPMRQRLDPNAHNGGMLVGLNGVVIKSHGGSNAKGFAAAIRVAANVIRSGINERITEHMHDLSMEAA